MLQTIGLPFVCEAFREPSPANLVTDQGRGGARTQELRAEAKCAEQSVVGCQVREADFSFRFVPLEHTFFSHSLFDPGQEGLPLRLVAGSGRIGRTMAAQKVTDDRRVREA